MERLLLSEVSPFFSINSTYNSCYTSPSIDNVEKYFFPTTIFFHNFVTWK
jgi:hypothetical protein